VEYPANHNAPDDEHHPQRFGVFERVNNYLLLLYAGACLIMNYSLGGLLYLRGMLILSLSVPGIVSILVPLFVLSRRFSLAFTEEYRLSAPVLRTTALSLLISGSATLPVEAISTFFERRWPPDSDYINFLLAIKPKGFLSFLAVALGVVIVAPFTEELLFRGFIQRIFMRNMRGALAVALGALLFGICHFDMPVLVPVTTLGILYGYLFLRTGNLFYPFLGHALFNLISLIRLHLASEGAIESSAVAYPDISWTAVSLVALLYGIRLIERLESQPETRI